MSKQNRKFICSVGYHNIKKHNRVPEMREVYNGFDGNDHVGKYLITCESSRGHTIAHSLRRVLLNEIYGTAVVAISINNAKHLFDSVNGIKETVIEIALNLRKFVVNMSAQDEPTVFEIYKTGPGIVYAGDLTSNNHRAEIINKNVKICTIDNGGYVDLQIVVVTHTGYVQSHEHKISALPYDTITLDALFNPITHVETKVNNNTSMSEPFDEVELKITSNGSITPIDALKKAASILCNDFRILAGDDMVEQENLPEEHLSKQDNMKNLPLSQFKDDLKVRAYNCLTKNKILTVGDLLDKTKEELLLLDGVGNRILEEIESFLILYGLFLKGNDNKNNWKNMDNNWRIR